MTVARGRRTAGGPGLDASWGEYGLPSPRVVADVLMAGVLCLAGAGLVLVALLPRDAEEGESGSGVPTGNATTGGAPAVAGPAVRRAEGTDAVDGAITDAAPIPPHDALAAEAAASFLHGVVDLGPIEREQWVRAYVAPSRQESVFDVVGTWVRRLNGGLEPDEDGGAALRLRTLGYRVVDVDGPAEAPEVLHLTLWQEVMRDVALPEAAVDGATGGTGEEPRGSTYVISHLTVLPTTGGYLVASLDAVAEAPPPESGIGASFLRLGEGWDGG